MAKILTKNSVSAGSAPSGLSFGELAVNITDKKIFIGNAVQGVVTLHDQQNVVTSINGATGAVTNVARINEGNTFSVLQVMNAGITTANLQVSGGATFSTVAATSTTNTIDAIASTDGIGLRVARAIGGGPSSVGGILLGRSGTTAYNYLLYTASGTFYVINGTGAAAPQLMTLNSVDANFNVPIRGATFSSTAGRITVQKSGVVFGGDSAVVRIVGHDSDATNAYNSDIRANVDAAADTTHTLPAVTGTLLNTASSYVASVNGSTGAVTNVARINEGNTFSVRQVMNSGITSANLYVSGGATFASAVVSDGGYRITSNAINAQTDSYSLQESDNGKIITMNAGSLKTITVPSGLSVGFNCTVIRIGTARVNFSASGTTINSIDGLLEIASQHGAASLLCYASNTFNLSGNLA